jgi:hypothetical protein
MSDSWNQPLPRRGGASDLQNGNKSGARNQREGAAGAAAGLTARERTQWREIVGALRPDGFEVENRPLLAEYVRTVEQRTRLARELRKVATRVLPGCRGRG